MTFESKKKSFPIISMSIFGFFLFPDYKCLVKCRFCDTISELFSNRLQRNANVGPLAGMEQEQEQECSPDYITSPTYISYNQNQNQNGLDALPGYKASFSIQQDVKISIQKDVKISIRQDVEISSRHDVKNQYLTGYKTELDICTVFRVKNYFLILV